MTDSDGVDTISPWAKIVVLHSYLHISTTARINLSFTLFYQYVLYRHIRRPTDCDSKVGKTIRYGDHECPLLNPGKGRAYQWISRPLSKSGFVDVDPKKTKKNGAGKGGWGINGEEVQDEGFNFTKIRRRSNSSSYSPGLQDFKTKFEQETMPEEEYYLQDLGREASQHRGRHWGTMQFVAKDKGPKESRD
ncbi:BgtA-20518 [Blumeria graminis f. sp. tritici]|uniref:BgtA-20518 n=2 Tax=Blumeria graminis f. sp. tritici TaxID=62690 RepID=A0A9X9PSK3_BLUGR|nr:hypothetical protein BGT96224_A20518 [Blumeria graminis f. sp. tritici 96224]VCU40976.1 BgtA-20518 [Blumeria graminis f. sp. tritici]